MSGSFGIGDRYRLIAVIPPPKSLDRLVRIALAFGYDPTDVFVETYREIGISSVHAVLFTLKETPTPKLSTPVVETVDDVPVVSFDSTAIVEVGSEWADEAMAKIVEGHGTAEDHDGEPSGVDEEGGPVADDTSAQTASPSVDPDPETDTPGLRPLDERTYDEDTEIVPCSECDKKFRSRNGMLIHFSRMHHASSRPADDFTCPDCGKAFDTDGALRGHRYRDHTLAAVPGDDVQQYGCADCGVTRETVGQLHAHVSVKHGRPLHASEREVLEAS